MFSSPKREKRIPDGGTQRESKYKFSTPSFFAQKTEGTPKLDSIQLSAEEEVEIERRWWERRMLEAAREAKVSYRSINIKTQPKYPALILRFTQYYQETRP